VDVDAALARLALAEPGHGVLLSPTWAALLNGKSFRVLPRSTFHPDARRLAENREVELRPMREAQQAESPSPWSSLCGRVGEALGRVFNSAVN